MAWVKGHYRKSSRGYVRVKGHSRKSSSGSGILLVLFIGAIYLIFRILKAFVELIMQYWIPISITIVSILAPVLIIFIIQFFLKVRNKQYTIKLVNLLNETIENLNFSEENLSRIKDLRSHLKKSQRIIEPIRQAYKQIIASFVDDGQIDDKEIQIIKNIENALSLPNDIIMTSRYEGFLEVYHDAISDGVLTQAEESSLQQILKALEIPSEIINEEMKFMDELSEVRRISEKPLAYIKAPMTLKDNEKCIYFTSANEIKRKKNRDQYTYDVISEGNIILTTNRIIYAAQGALSIKLTDIINANVMPDNKYISITKDGRQTPYLFQVEKPYLCIEYINMALNNI